MTSRLAVVTVNYCCADEIVRNLVSLLPKIRRAGGEWWIVDNRSPDDSLLVLLAATARLEGVHVLAAARNGGFGYGNNVAVTRLLAAPNPVEYIYFLNPDAVPCPGAIDLMTAYLDAHPDVAVVGSALIDEHGRHADSMFRFPTALSEFEAAAKLRVVTSLFRRHRQSLPPLDEPGPVDWVAGTSLMIRSSVLEELGGFDEDFFLYWEETELCHRIRRAGHSIHGVPAAKVRHAAGLTTGLHRPDRRIPGYWHQSRNLYFRKTDGGVRLPLINLLTAVGLMLSRVAQALGRPARANPHQLRDHVHYAIRDLFRPIRQSRPQ